MGTELVRGNGQDGWRERFPATLEAFTQANGANTRKSALGLAKRIPDLLEDGEQLRLLFQALRRDTMKAKVVVVLTDRRYLLWNEMTGELGDDAPIESVDIPVFVREFWHGTRMEVRTQAGAMTLKQLLPEREADRFFWLVCGEEPLPESTALMGDAPSVPLEPPVASCWNITLYPDRLIDHEYRHLPLSGDVTATVDTAGSIAVTRGRNLAAKGAGTLLLGPVGLFLAGNAKHREIDHRELYLLVEGSTWAYTQAFNPDRGGILRQFAQSINVAARQFAAQAEEASAGNGAAGIAAELRELAELREGGVLTGEEFAQAKAKLLGSG